MTNQGTNPYFYALSCISGKWKMSLLNHINYYGSIRFYQTRKVFPISEKVLSQQLKELIDDGLVERIQYNEIPLRVEYVLTETGKTIIPIIDMLYTWSIERMRELNIEIDPDAFVVHPEEKYEAILSELIGDFDALYEVCTILKKNNLTFSDVAENLKEHLKNE